MFTQNHHRALAVAVLISLAPLARPAAAQGSVELEQSLFLQKGRVKDAKGAEVPGVLLVVSIPQPIQKYCMGKTADQCAAIDFCIRTTTKSVAMCQKLPAALRNLPPYPAGMRPNRQYSISFFKQSSNFPSNIPGMDRLRAYFDHAPPASLDVFSTHASFKAKIRFTKTANDGDFELLEVLSVPAS